jgi:hypothetical protein
MQILSRVAGRVKFCLEPGTKDHWQLWSAHMNFIGPGCKPYGLCKHFAFTRREPRTYRTRALPQIASARRPDTG